MKCRIKIFSANKTNNNENTNILFNKISTRADFTDISSIYNDINRLNEGDKVPGVIVFLPFFEKLNSKLTFVKCC